MKIKVEFDKYGSLWHGLGLYRRHKVYSYGYFGFFSVDWLPGNGELCIYVWKVGIIIRVKERVR